MNEDGVWTAPKFSGAGNDAPSGENDYAEGLSEDETYAYEAGTPSGYDSLYQWNLR
ncbi:MAG: hypothetical protein ACLSFZ_10560 [Frisingicoccus sp.]